MRARRLAFAAAAAFLPAAAGAQTAALPPVPAAANEPIAMPRAARLAWADEFDSGRLPDPKRWSYDTARNKQGWYNDERQYYAANRAENARIEQGRLILEARRERLSSEPDYGGQDYSSVRLFTRGLASWTYGFVEVRAKLPCGKGLWPAIWLLGADGKTGWPHQGEIDVMEQVGWDPQTIHGTIHTGAYNHARHTQKGATARVADACTAFHRYQLDWNRDRILIGVDGHAYMRFDNDHKGDPATWPFDKPQYLLLNLAVGGWGGMQGIDRAAFPSRMEVDYVRVWQVPEQKKGR
ncbi:glycoside hydrolase family 16 protein [Sphingomonas elodea]|uniref:glycoside hydrolase family 16 protein n=1 Tax=Sphingomonas elodea TaxID=179878 RepID=UPI00026306D2|nr:glycoside hydrolase family 16 protein [Sphingomonas elodea]